MKTTMLFAVCLVLLAEVCSPQVHKGVIPIGGSVSFYYSDDEYPSKSFSTWINPKIGYYLNERDVIGFSIFENLSWSKSSFDTLDFKSTHNSISINPFWRRDFPRTDRFGFYIQLQAGIGYEYWKDKNNLGHSSDDAVELFSRFNPGLYYFLTDRLSAEGAFGSAEFHSRLHKTDRIRARNTFSLSFGATTLFLGLQYYFNK